jgi:ATP-dependent RNA helicase DDX35
VVYATAVQTDKLYMHDVTAIEVQWLAELAPHFYTPVHKA